MRGSTANTAIVPSARNGPGLRRRPRRGKLGCGPTMRPSRLGSGGMGDKRRHRKTAGRFSSPPEVFRIMGTQRTVFFTDLDVSISTARIVLPSFRSEKRR